MGDTCSSAITRVIAIDPPGNIRGGGGTNLPCPLGTSATAVAAAFSRNFGFSVYSVFLGVATGAVTGYGSLGFSGALAGLATSSGKSSIIAIGASTVDAVIGSGVDT